MRRCAQISINCYTSNEQNKSIFLPAQCENVERIKNLNDIAPSVTSCSDFYVRDLVVNYVRI